MITMTGDNVRSLREKLGLTQLDLSILTGVTERSVRRWEEKGVGPVVARLLTMIAAEGGVDV